MIHVGCTESSGRNGSGKLKVVRYVVNTTLVAVLFFSAWVAAYGLGSVLVSGAEFGLADRAWAIGILGVGGVMLSAHLLYEVLLGRWSGVDGC